MRKETLTTPAAETPVSLDEVKAYLRITSTSEDDLLTALIQVATDQLEAYARRDFVEKTYTAEYDNVMVSTYERYPYVNLYRAPLAGVDSVQISVDGTFVDESYQEKDQPGFAILLFDEYGDDLDDIPFPLKIQFNAGYGDASAVPEGIKQAIKMYVNYLYENRGDCEPDCGLQIPLAVKGLLGPYKIIHTFGGA